MTKLIALGLLAATVYGTLTLATKPAYPQTCYNYGGIVQCSEPLGAAPHGSFSNGLNSGLGALNSLQNRDYLYERTRQEELEYHRRLMEMQHMCSLPDYRNLPACKDYR